MGLSAPAESADNATACTTSMVRADTSLRQNGPRDGWLPGSLQETNRLVAEACVFMEVKTSASRNTTRMPSGVLVSLKTAVRRSRRASP